MTDSTTELFILFLGGPADGEIVRAGDDWWADFLKTYNDDNYAISDTIDAKNGRKMAIYYHTKTDNALGRLNQNTSAVCHCLLGDSQ